MAAPISGLGQRGVYFSQHEPAGGSKSYVDLIRGQFKLNPQSNPFYNDVLTKLLSSDNETNGHPKLPTGSRESVLALLEKLFVDREALHDHIQWLQSKLGRQFRHNELLPDEQEDAIVNSGLHKLDNKTISNEELASLVLNPVALCCFADRIDEELPVAWFDALAHNGRQLMDKEGLKVPTLEEIINRGNKINS